MKIDNDSEMNENTSSVCSYTHCGDGEMVDKRFGGEYVEHELRRNTFCAEFIEVWRDFSSQIFRPEGIVWDDEQRRFRFRHNRSTYSEMKEEKQKKSRNNWSWHYNLRFSNRMTTKPDTTLVLNLTYVLSENLLPM